MITSPPVIPARAAGVLGRACWTTAPEPAEIPLDAAWSAGMTPTPSSPVGPMWMVSDAWPASIWWASVMAWLIGIAKAWVRADCWNWNPEEPDAAVSMPITLPVVLTSGPPESPGWMGALWWISPVSCSEVPAPSSDAVIDAPRPATWPTATDGVPPLPSALPSATTLSPTFTEDESPSAAVCSPEAPTAWMTAMSRVWSYPTTLAAYVRPFPMSRTLIEVAPLITWLLVRISPDCVSTTPVPAARACCRPRLVMTSTRPGSVWVAIWAVVSTALRDEAVAAISPKKVPRPATTATAARPKRWRQRWTGRPGPWPPPPYP